MTCLRVPRWIVLVALLTVAAGAASSNARLAASEAQLAQGAAANQAQVSDITPEALAQIAALVQEKASRTPAQQKLASHLVYAIKMARGEAIAAGVARLDVKIAIDATDANRVTVDVHANVNAQLLQQLQAMNVDIVHASAPYRSIRLKANLDQLETIAALPQVIFIQPKAQALTSRFAGSFANQPMSPMTIDPLARTPLRRPFDRAKFTAALQRAIGQGQGQGQGPGTNVAVGTGQGSRETEGDTTHRAFSARGTFHVDGTGVKIGVLSDDVCSLAASQASGDLGAVTVLPGQTGSCPGGDEGTAMLEIIHDLAPGAQLYFATAFISNTSFAQNIRDLRTAGCDIIVDDIFYFNESAFQDGQDPAVISPGNASVIAQAVKDVVADGALYFSAAGNEGNLDAGSSGTWEGDFLDGGAIALPLPSPADSRLHSFGANAWNVLTASGGNANDLRWSDPIGASSNDYDLFLLNSAGTAVLDASTDIQNGTQDPYEIVTPGATGNRLVIVKSLAAAARFLHLGTIRGRLSVATAGETHGHSAVNSANAFGVAATPAAAPFTATTPGPYPNPFTSANAVESFTSNGPRRIFFSSDGTPITPGNFSSTGGLVLNKPDITAADGTTVTGVGGFPSPFYGTSAAAPHAAAIAALIKSSNPALTATQITAALNASAIDIGTPGLDRNSGLGIIMAYTGLQAAGAPGTAFLVQDGIAATDNPGNANGKLEAGEGGKIFVTLDNLGVNAATVISATLTSSTPGITMTLPGTATYPTIASNASGVNATPFLFTVASNVPCPLTANFTLTVTYSGGGSPAVFPFTVPIGTTSFTISTTLDGVAPAAAPDGGTSTTGLQTGRLSRNGVPSACSPPKANPGLTTAVGSRQYDAFNFNTCAGSIASCVSVTVTQPGITLGTVAYNPSFAPATPSTNFVGDSGLSATTMTYGFPVAAGAGTYAVVVHGINVGGGVGTAYTLTVDGACGGACAVANGVPVALVHDVTVHDGLLGFAQASINNGSFDTDGNPLTLTQSPPGPYPIGVTPVLLTVTDTKGATSQASATVTVITGSDIFDPRLELVLRHKSTGQNVGWLMNGLTVFNSAFLPTIADTNWEVKARGDFNGIGTSDAILRHKTNGQNFVFFLSGLAVSTSSFLPTIADTNWQIQGAGDLDGDHKADILWRNTSTGQNLAWLMNGATVALAAPLPTIADTNWAMKGVGDFNGDGKADVILRNRSTGQNIVWLMNGATISLAAFLPTIADTNWDFVGTGDLDGNGRSDILLRNKATGQNIGWLMNGTTVGFSAFLPTVADTNWEVKSLGDFDNDGHVDVIWRNKSTGQNIGWLMNGLTVTFAAFLPTIADTNWEIVGS